MATSRSRSGQQSRAKKGSSRRRGSSNGAGVKAQRARAAEQARKKADKRRSQASGAAGWVAEGAGDWSLDDWDPSWMERQKYFWNPLIDYWFRMEMGGWENIPDPPNLIVGIHSG